MAETGSHGTAATLTLADFKRSTLHLCCFTQTTPPPQIYGEPLIKNKGTHHCKEAVEQMPALTSGRGHLIRHIQRDPARSKGREI